MSEIFIILLLLTSGAAVLRPLGIYGWPLLPLGFLCSLALFTITGYLQAFLGISSSWLFPLGFVAALSAGFYTYQWRRGNEVAFNWYYVLLSLSIVAIFVFLIMEVNLFKYHFDSFRYLVAGSILHSGDVASLSPNLLTKRFSSVSILHSLGHLADGFYLRSLTPLISLSALASLYWVVNETFKQTLQQKWIVVGVAVAILVLATNHGYVWHSFYLNGHLLFGTFFLLAIGSGWLLAKRAGVAAPKQSLVTILCLSLAGAVLTRPEGVLFALFAILPFLLSMNIKTTYRIAALSSIGIATLLQQGFIINNLLNIGRSLENIPSDILGLFLLGGLAVISAPFLIFNYTDLRRKYLLGIAELGLWGLLVFFTVRNPAILTDSISATYENLVAGAGNWGLMVLLSGVIFLISLAWCRFKDQIYIRYTVTTFVPLVFIMAYLRDAAFRVGVTDSLNRIIMQVLLVLILYIVLASLHKYKNSKNHGGASES